MDTLTLTAPVRIDIGGGVTDIPTIAQSLGTTLTNIAVTVYRDSHYEHPLSLRAWTKKAKTPGISLLDTDHNLKKKDRFLTNFATFLKKKYPLSKNEIVIENPLPIHTGLGSSGTIALLLTSIFTLLYERKIEDLWQILHEARTIEVEKLGIAGGIQDYIAAAFGGINFVNTKSLYADTTDGIQHGIHCETKLKQYLDTHMVFIQFKNGRISSEDIVNDEIKNFQKNKQQMTHLLRTIQQANKIIFPLLTTDGELTNRLTTIQKNITKSWQAQKQLSGLVSSPLSNEIEKILQPLSYGIRGPGCGANSLFFIAKENTLHQCLEQLTPYEKEISIYFLRVSDRGLRMV